MAGYILKVLLEGTRPPVWRRVIVPEKITFADLHEIIGAVFGWEDEHLHDFVTPSRRVSIGSDQEGDYDYDEQSLLVDRFWDACKWVRYTYDFGDNWQHKVIYEKTDEDYHSRTPLLMKAKGDTYCEDSGGVMSAGSEDRIPLDHERTNRRLMRMIFPERTGEELHIPESPTEMMKRFASLLSEEWDRIQKGAEQEEVSLIGRKAEKWKKNAEEWQSVTLIIEPGKKTNEELLMDLSPKEAGDYCKYLQIMPVDPNDEKDMVHQIAQTFKSHPEYLLYVFLEDEYQEFLRWSSQPCGEFRRENKFEDMPVKAIALGLMDVSFTKMDNRCVVTVSFASDLTEILKPLKNVRPIFQWIKRYSDRLRNFILVYGMIEMDALYDMFCSIYSETIAREDFLRFVYWHARFNNKIQTMYTPDYENYAAAVPINGDKVLKDQIEYAEELDYRIWTRSELKRKADDIMEEHRAFQYLFEGLFYGARLPEPVVNQIMNDIAASIQNGRTITEIFEGCILSVCSQIDLETTCSLWENLASAMLEMELPMLKGRSREEYAAHKKISPWQLQMISSPEEKKNTKDRHIWEFPPEIQEKLYVVRNCNRPGLDDIWEYEEKESTSSEEFLFLLADTCMIFNEQQRADALIRRLKKSSPRGKKAAEFLMTDLDAEDEKLYQELENLFQFGGYTDERTVVQKPYVRKNAKIGRNDPCPCGSGKKYKRCCGR